MLDVFPELSLQESFSAGGWVPCPQAMELEGALPHPLHK